MSEGDVVVVHIDELSKEVVNEAGSGLIRRLKKEGCKWLIVKGVEVIEGHRTREEAEMKAELIRLADRIVRDIREYAAQKFKGLTEHQIRAIWDYLGSKNLIIPIQRQAPGEVKTYELQMILFGKPAWEIEGLDGNVLDADFAKNLEALGEDLYIRLKTYAKVMRKLLERGWTAIGGQYDITLRKRGTWEEVVQDVIKAGVDPEALSEVEEE